MLPDIDWALQRGLGVVVFNPNQRHVEEGDGSRHDLHPVGTAIPSAASYADHTLLVWDTYLAHLTCPLLILAHSNGGHCTRALLEHRGPALLRNLRAVALTDANSMARQLPAGVKEWALGQGSGPPGGRIVNWVADKGAVDTPVRSTDNGVQCRSSGATAHVHTTAAARPAMHPWLESWLPDVLAVSPSGADQADDG
ncbi:true [Symbiodinium sp. KB8]|nr:true [Symbiodinium sp. KB8]